MSKPRSHLLDIYSVWLHLATTEQEWRRLRKLLPSLDKNPTEAMASTSLTLHEKPEGACIPHITIWFDVTAHEGNIIAMVETCAHEADHAAGTILDHFETEYDGHSEPHAYLVGWIAQWLWIAVVDGSA